MSIADLRQEYMRTGLAEAQAHADPLVQFERWFQDALAAELPLANAMTLATVSAAGAPTARVVLLKGLERGGFVFYTNYGSRKGRELAAQPLACLVFLWSDLERQVRVEGRVEQVAARDSDAYYAGRPLGARLSAWASAQSDTVADRAALERALEAMRAKYGERPPRPPQEPILSGFLVWRILFVAVLLVCGTFGLFAWSLAAEADLQVARTIAVNALVVFEVVYLLNCRLIMAPSATREGLLGSRAVLLAIALVVGLQLLYTYAPPLQALFGSAALGWHEWPLMLVAGLLVFAMVELEKSWQRRRRRAFRRPQSRARSAPDASAV